jgi:hypothetical protein
MGQVCICGDVKQGDARFLTFTHKKGDTTTQSLFYYLDLSGFTRVADDQSQGASRPRSSAARHSPWWGTWFGKKCEHRLD